MKVFFFLIMILTLSVGCKGGSGGSSNAKSTTSAPIPVPVSDKVLEEHIGVWAECVADSSTTSMFRMYNLSSNSLIASFAFYSNLNCQSSGIQFENRIVYEVTRIGDTHQASIVGSSSRSRTTSDVSYNNTNSYCGYSDWSLDTAKDTLNRDCEGETNISGAGPDFYLERSGSNLILTAGKTNINLQPLHSLAFGHNGTLPTNGAYVFYHEEIAHVININNGFYNIHQVNPRTLEYHMESGEYSISGDIVTLTMTSETPSCGTVGSQRSFKYSPSSLVIIFKDGDGLVTAESFDWTPTNFSDAFVGTSTALGCF